MKSSNSVLRYLKVKEKFCVLYGKRRQEDIVAGREIMVSISCMFGMIVVETRRDSLNIKRWDKEIYSNVCVEVGMANFLGE